MSEKRPIMSCVFSQPAILPILFYSCPARPFWCNFIYIYIHVYSIIHMTGNVLQRLTMNVSSLETDISELALSSLANRQ